MKIKLNLNLFILFLLTATLFFTISACKDKEVTFPKIDTKALGRDDYFEISENGCMVGCPFFNMRILGDGTFKFQEHKSYYSEMAPISGKLSTENTNKLFQTIADFGFEEFAMSRLKCESIESEHTTERIELYVSGKKFEVSHNHGCTDFKRKSELLQFERDLNSILSIDKFLKKRS